MRARVDDAVVGAGVLGLAHAFHLARRGRRVAVFERNPKAAGASVRNFGMLWPIGQPAGRMRRMATRSLEIWRQVLPAAGLWHAQTGSLHLAYREDEARVLREFVGAARADGDDCELLEPSQVAARSRAVRLEGLIAALWSPAETCVDPREVIAGLPEWLEREYGVQFLFGCAVTAFDAPRLLAGGEEWQAERLFVCAGEDSQSLFPDTLESARLVRCKLQMMRSQPYGDRWRIGPMLAAGLTLRHYAAFQQCPSLPALRQRIAEETPLYDRYGIHVMASQNGRGEIVIGDSHEYDADIEPFDKQEIDDLILEYLRTFLDAPGLRIAARWHGVYVRHPAAPYFVAHPLPEATVITGVGGAGMTLSFGLAEQVVREALGEA
jgi:FAD dependent oxidoreductase TIGR03364